MIERSHVLALADALEKEGASLGTLAAPFAREEDFVDPNQVKVVLDQEGFALYFSRSPIPHPREPAGQRWGGNGSFAYKHLGTYAYKASFLESYARLGQGVLERIERLEQLRALENGYRIGVSLVQKATVGVDVPGDLEKLTFSN